MRPLYILLCLISLIACNDEQKSANFFALGNIEYNAKRYDTAIDLYTKAIDADSKNYEAYFYRACAESELKDAKNAFNDFTQSAKIAPHLSMAFGYRGFVRIRLLKDTLQALEDFDTANIVSEKPSAIWYFDKGMFEVDIRKYKEALKDFDKAISIKPDEGTIYSNRAGAELFLGDTTNAMLDCNKAIGLNMRDGIAYFNKALVERKEKVYGRAIQDFNTDSGLEPEFVKFDYYYRGEAEYYMGQKDEACNDFNRALEAGYKGSDTLIRKLGCEPIAEKPFDIDTNKGRVLYRVNCAMCHSINADVVIVGPPLQRATKFHPDAWLSQFITDSQKLLDEKDESAINIYNKFHTDHPKHTELSKEEINNLLAYLRETKSK